MKTLIALFVTAALVAPALAQSAEGFIVADISMQSGPDLDYPPVDQLAAGTPVVIEGCIEGWTWCDVIAGDLRGWVPGTYIEEDYDGRWVYITDYGPRIGLPIVVFSLNTYWGAHYRNRPWYGEHERWATRTIQPRMPARPPGEAHAPPQRSMQSTAPAANPQTPPRATPQPNSAVAPNTERRPIESNQQREATPPVQRERGASAPSQQAQPERAMPRTPTAEPAHRPPPPAPKSANPPQPKPEAKPKPKGEKPPVKKEDQQDRHEENNGHGGEVI